MSLFLWQIGDKRQQPWLVQWMHLNTVKMEQVQNKFMHRLSSIRVRLSIELGLWKAASRNSDMSQQTQPSTTLHHACFYYLGSRWTNARTAVMHLSVALECMTAVSFLIDSASQGSSDQVCFSLIGRKDIQKRNNRSYFGRVRTTQVRCVPFFFLCTQEIDCIFSNSRCYWQ